MGTCSLPSQAMEGDTLSKFAITGWCDKCLDRERHAGTLSRGEGGLTERGKIWTAL